MISENYMGILIDRVVMEQTRTNELLADLISVLETVLAERDSESAEPDTTTETTTEATEVVKEPTIAEAALPIDDLPDVTEPEEIIVKRK